MLYMLVPRSARSWSHFRMFLTYASAEQTALTVARGIVKEGRNPDWCEIVAYDGVEELQPVFVYTLVGADYLRREEWPTPSS